MRSSKERMRARVRRPRTRRRLADLPVNRMVPNVLTLLALCAGMTAIRYAVSGDFQYAVFAIIAAGIFDGLAGGEEEIFPDPASASVAAGWRAGTAKALERQFNTFVPDTMTV